MTVSAGTLKRALAVGLRVDFVYLPNPIQGASGALASD